MRILQADSRPGGPRSSAAAQQASAAALETAAALAAQTQQWEQFQSTVASDRAADALVLYQRLGPLISDMVDKQTEIVSRDNASGQAVILAALEDIRTRAGDSERASASAMAGLKETVRRIQDVPRPHSAVSDVTASILQDPSPPVDTARSLGSATRAQHQHP